ncbi:unnamed protein product [Cochlearia groenlandica]
MVSVTKLRIKFGHESSVKTFHNFSVLNTCNNAKKLEESISEDVIKAANQSKKRGFDEIEEAQAKKKRKLNSDMSSKCFTVLRLLRDHEHGWIFSEPVDPVRLNIPDYFSVVSKPMDLGTIKSKLSKSVYGNADEFAGDVRLTFTNGMMYNPPDNMVHKMAKELKEVFEARWASLKKEKDLGVSKIEVRECSKRQPETSVKEKSEKFSLSLKPVKIQIISDTSPVTHKVLPTKLRIKKLDQGIRVSSTVKSPCKDSASTTACKCGSYGRMACVCFKSCNSFGSEVSSLTDCEVMNTSGVQASVSDPHSNGSISSKNDKNSCVSSQLEIPLVPSMPPLPPEKALRAAMLKAQFAETILRAKHGKSLDQSNKAILTRIQIEKQQMQKTQREEKARIEAEIKTAKMATRMRAETELRQRRERQRLQLEKMEKTFDFEENNVLRLREEMVKLCGSSNPTRTLLLKLGLFLRNDDDVEEIESELRKEDLEEGEIL